MKKILTYCVFSGFMLVGVMSFAYADPPQFGDRCDTDEFQLPDKGSQPVDCRNNNLSNAQECYVYCNDGTPIFGIRSCKPGFYPLDPHTKPSDLYQQCVSKAVACNASDGAHWNGTDCDCGDKRYEWNDVTMRCEDSAAYKACNKQGSKASWNNQYGTCQCSDPIRYYWTGTQCALQPDEAECNSFRTKSEFKGKVEWNALRRHCDCTHEPNGNAITNPNDWRVDAFGNECVKTTEAKNREKFAANKPAADEKLKAIQKVMSELEGISKNIGKSHWKNADGGFNTARLASDSVAGVVLGTVGGVITSNVIKKNQIKGGFEDINCVIGGQRVAGYADQFNVGIQ